MEELYYIQNGYSGNAIMWWGKDSRGYTTDLNNAHRYTLEEVVKIIERPEDRAWPCSYIDGNEEAKKTTVDSQYLNPNYMMIGKTK